MNQTDKLAATTALTRLMEIMATLRGENGCPWDREQTHASLRPCVIEEAYEVVEAIDLNRMDKLREELGDLLLQVVFHGQLAAERSEFGMAEIIEGIAAKLERRHPHVFGDLQVQSVSGVIENWEKIKKSEAPEERKSALDGVPPELPALMRAAKLQSKAAKVGFDWPDLAGPLAKIQEELAEFTEVLAQEEAPPPKDSPEWQRLEDEFGDLLFALVNAGRFLKINSELALRRTIQKFTARFHYMEQEALRTAQNFKEMPLAEKEHLWQAAKEKRK